MKAEDTSFSKEIEDLSELENMGDLNKDIMRMLDIQAKISFGAGMAEMLEWLIKNVPLYRDSSNKFIKALQAKLKYEKSDDTGC